MNPGKKTMNAKLTVLGLQVIVLGALGTSACSEADSSSAVSLKRDSAGVQIIDNGRPDSAMIRWWSLEHPAFVDIGGALDDGSYALVQVTGAKRLSDGRLAVIDAGTSELQMYRSDGGHLQTIGRCGNGPGEFQHPSALIILSGDTLLVTDSGLRRISVFDPSGRFIRSVPFVVQGSSVASPSARFADGSLLAVRATFGSGPMDGIQRAVQTFTRVASDYTASDTIVSVPGNERLVRLRAGTSGSIGSVMMTTPPFAKMTLHAVAGDHLFVATQDAPQIEIYTNTGVLTGIIRTGHELRPVTSQLLSAWVDRNVSQLSPDQRRAREDMLRNASPPKFAPIYGALHTDGSGNLWVQDYAIDDSMPGRWSIFDPDGRLIAYSTMPSGLRIFEIGADYVLGVEKDALDVEHVRMYRLRKAR